MPGRPLMAWMILLRTALIGWMCVSSALAQEAAETPPPVEPSAIAIELEHFGVGDATRPGDWVGVRVALTDTTGAGSARNVVVRLHVPDPDGDTLLAQRAVTLTAGRRQGVWLYAPMPWQVPSLFNVTVHELLDSDDPLGSAGRQLSARRVTPSTVLDADHALIGVVGNELYALDQYELPGNNAFEAHEWIEVRAGIQPRELPDRWEGLLPYDVIVWGDADATALGSERPRALIEWVRRGGHLVVVMPTIGGVWFTRDDPFATIMPLVEPVRLEDADYEPYRKLLSTVEYEEEELPRVASLHAFEREQGVDPVEASPIIGGPDGVVVTRRLVGVGMVTVVGLDLAHPDIKTRRSLRAEAFWHRLLGKRFPIRTQVSNIPRGPESLLLDRHIAGAIENTARAGAGILLAVVLFSVYWLIAGPLGFALLKAQGYHRHAWLIFFGTVATFALIAWAGANSLADRSVRARHVTILDQVYGRSYQRTRTYAGVMMPGYGDRTIAVGDGAIDANSRNLVSVWNDPTGSGFAARFPDARSYPLEVADPASLRSPVRATVKTVRAEWAGGVRWQTIRPYSDDHAPRVTNRSTLTGTLVHSLPGELENITVVLCGAQRGGNTLHDPDAPNTGGRLVVRMQRWELPGTWAPGEGLDLAQRLPNARARTGQAFLDLLVPQGSTSFGLTSGGASDGRASYSRSEARADINRLTWLPLLHQPTLDATRQQHIKQRMATHAGHGLDLARFTTQPCLIIIGHLYDAESPTPLRDGADGDLIPTEGHTVVRWIYPLTPEPLIVGGL